VIIPSHLGGDRIPICLRSLARQTLDQSLFEVIVALNGPSDGTRDVLERFRLHHPGISLTITELAEAGASAARNAAIALACREHTTFLDDDDSFSPAYLETLLAHTRAGIVPFGQIVDIAAGGRAEPDNPINRQTIPYTGQTVSPHLVPRALGFNACKLLPTRAVQSVKYDTSLRSGVDVVYFGTLLAHHHFDLFICPVDSGPDAANAVYYRLLRPNSMSRREETFEFSVIGRLDVISRLDPLLRLCDDDRRRVLMSSINAQVGFIGRYLATHAGERDQVLRAAAGYELASLPPDRLDRLTR
jgi:glycosyltransferase involved in cell wall biosynthesis